MKEEQKYHVVFFAGGETRDDKFNIFTGNFIEFLSKIFEDKFSLIKGIYFRYPMFNVAWGLNHAQYPMKEPDKNRITSAAIRQIIPENNNSNTTLIILSSSAGSIIAAQTACYLVNENIKHNYYINPFHLVLGTNFISKDSDLFKTLIRYQKDGRIGAIIFDELQDEGDSVYQTGGTTRGEAWLNAFGLILPWFSRKFSPPSFLNTHPVKGHLHRRRSQSIKKVEEFIDIIFVKNNIAGDYFRKRAVDLLSGNVTGKNNQNC